MKKLPFLIIILYIFLILISISSSIHYNYNNNDIDDNNNNNNKNNIINRNKNKNKNNLYNNKVIIKNDDDDNDNEINNNKFKIRLDDNEDQDIYNEYHFLNKVHNRLAFNIFGSSSENSGGSGGSNSGSSSNSKNTDSSTGPTPSPISINGTLNSTATVYWSGGKSSCESVNCTEEGFSMGDSYACSYEITPIYQRGQWEKGIKYFKDPLPKSILTSQVIGVSFVINGVVGCTPLKQELTTIEFLIQDVQVGQTISTNRSDDCSCGICYKDYEILPQSYDLLGYNKSGLNKVQLLLLDNSICATSLDIIFYYHPSTIPPTPTPTPSKPTISPLKKYLIIGFSIVGGLLIIGGCFLLIRNRYRSSGYYKPDKNGYTQIKDGKDIDIHQIKIGVRIGKGNYGEVYLGTWRGSQVAVKKLPAHNLNENILKEFNREINLMKNLRHPNVIQFLGSCLIPPDICICTEYMPRGSLYSILHDQALQLQWSLLIKMMIDAAKGVIYLHNSTPVILHRDLKSHNLLVDENWKVKVADFGLSTIEQQGATMTACGTPCWTSPEVLRSQRYTEKADVYSFGIILWECATRQDPYFGIPPFQVIFAVGREGMRPPVPQNGPPKYIQLLIDCLNENPSHRPTMEQCLERLESIDSSGYSDLQYVHQQL
ncbi:hypothetical protein ACTFIW_008227 [Dictyostelium discoideum]